MQRVVMKFGGTSVGDLARIDRVARLVAHEAEAGAKIAVVVSAMAGETDRLLALSQGDHGTNTIDYADERDAILASGEQVSAGLLAIALRRRGLPARSWTGWQAGVRTDAGHGHARISAIDADGLRSAVDSGEIAVACGFQGLNAAGRITTLGRGGSDVSAVALAAALNAERCDIYTDVEGVFTTDPRIERRARLIEKITYEEMLELASMGAKVLHTRSVELAMARNVRLRVLSSFSEPGQSRLGTLICSEDATMERRVVNGIAYTRDEVRVTLFGVPDQPGSAAAIFGELTAAGANVDMIVQSPSATEGLANIAFTVGRGDHERGVAALEAARDRLGYSRLEALTELGKVSVVGLGMRSHAGVAQTMFQALASKGVSIKGISTSEIKISALIDADYVELAVRVLHAAFELDKN